MRDITKQKEQGRKRIRGHEKADISVMEIMQLKDNFYKTAKEMGISEAIFNIVCDSFYFGVAVGYRNGKKDSTK